jgi:hypothetical protein
MVLTDTGAKLSKSLIREGTVRRTTPHAPTPARMGVAPTRIGPGATFIRAWDVRLVVAVTDGNQRECFA